MLLAGPAMAVGPTTLTTVATTTQKTSVTGDLTINSGAGVTLKSATVPLIEIDSSNTVNNGGVLTAADQGTATAVQIDANGFTGSFLNNGQINLGGTGTGKTAIYLKGTGTFTGNIVLDTGSAIAIAGDQSTGIVTDSGATLNGNLLLGGTLQMAPTAANSTSATSITIANLQGIINGNVIIQSGASYSAIGNGAQGIVIGLGGIHACNAAAVPGCTDIGSFVNSGTIAVGGVSVRNVNAKNAESGSALVINGSIDGGILNNGPSAAGDATTAASITGNGISPVVLISGTLTGVTTIGIDTADAANGNGCSDGTAAIGCSFINRGTIIGIPVDANENARAIVIGGTPASPITFLGGFFSSGVISAQATSIEPGTAVTATALEIDTNVTIPEIHVSGQSATTSGSLGSIAASINGPQGGSARGVVIFGASLLADNSKIPVLTVERGARIVTDASTTSPATAGVGLVSVAVQDDSGSLTKVINAGTISATATTLTNGSTAQTTALFLLKNTSGVDVENSGTITGDIIFGSGGDTYHVEGDPAFGTASHTSGTIDFGASLSGSFDRLVVGQLANVAGTIKSEGNLDVGVMSTGVLTVQNVGSTMATRNLSVAGGNTNTAGTINITVSQTATIPVITSSGDVFFGSGANLNVQYGSFITQGGSFILIQAGTSHLHIDPNDVLRYNAAIGTGTNLPFLFQTASIGVVSGGGFDSLVLSVQPKTAAQLQLTGYGAALFSLANTALTSDAQLGAAFVAGVNSLADAQKAYDAFAPDLSGGVRAIAISLTDQGTGVVAARQRTLRLFAKEQGDLTLWGNEFGQYINNKGGNTTQRDAAFAGITGAEPGFKDRGFGFSLGLDTGSAPTGWYGAAFSFYSGDVSEGGNRNSREQTLWYLLSAYSDWRGRGLFFDSQLNLGYGNVKGKRFIDLVNPATNTTFSREADSKRATLLASIGFTAGAMMNFGGLVMTPQISLDGLTMREEGYTETGGGTGFNLTVKPYYANSLRVFFGSDFRGDINLGDFLLQPSARLGYRFDLLNNPAKLRAQFADLDPVHAGAQAGTPFTLQGPDPSRGNAVAGAALNATTDNWTIGLNFDYIRGSHNETEEVGTLSLLGRI